MKIIFMGTPEFALPSLKKIDEKYGVASIFTKIDKPNMRGKKIKFTPIKEYALEHGIEIFQPKNFDEETIESIRQIKPDLIVVVAYGKILPKEVIDIPKYGTINLHSSLLPKYRGAAPINAAIINGEEESGVSVMFIEERLDAGDVILKKKVKIDDEMTFLSLHDKLKEIGAELLLDAIELLKNNNAPREKQDENLASYVKPFKKEDCRINWEKSSKEIYNFVRGMNPFPTAYSILNDKQVLKIYEVKKYANIYNDDFECGEVVDVIKGEGVVVKTKDGSLILSLAKPENKKILKGIDLINGNFIKIGDKLC